MRDRLETAELNVRLFLGTKAILDAAAEDVRLDIPGMEGALEGPHIRVGPLIALYNTRLEELREERGSRESGETRLEKALKMPPPIDPQKLRPSADSLRQLKANTLKDAQGEEWLWTKVRGWLQFQGTGERVSSLLFILAAFGQCPGRTIRGAQAMIKVMDGTYDVNGCTNETYMGWAPIGEQEGRQICEYHFRRHDDPADSFNLRGAFGFKRAEGGVESALPEAPLLQRARTSRFCVDLSRPAS